MSRQELELLKLKWGRNLSRELGENGEPGQKVLSLMVV